MRRRARILCALLVVAGLLALTGGLVVSLPALLLATLLLLGYFPGENAILSRRVGERPRLPDRACRFGSTGRTHVITPTGSALIAFGLAKRPPPAALL